ncbi:hypothetical protein AC249_AIPGENE18665 [Exaiptasia diaphana]|nr:hypothetical protein AC249_AIPGENE18665 [Exaiptasia diaphana]
MTRRRRRQKGGVVAPQRFNTLLSRALNPRPRGGVVYMGRGRQRGRGLGSVFAKLIPKLIKPLMGQTAKKLVKQGAKQGAKALAEGTVAAGAEYGVNRLLKGRGRQYKRRLLQPPGPRSDVKRYWSALMKANPQQRQQLVRYATPDQVDAVSEMAYNVLRGTPPLAPEVMRRLRPYKKILRGMGNPRRSLTSRRRWIRQNGGSAVSALVKGVAQGLKQGVRKGVKEQKGRIVQGLKKGAQRSLKKGVRKLLPTTVDIGEEQEEQEEVSPVSQQAPAHTVMKYTKKAYLRLTPPASPVQSGGAVRVGQPDITQLLKTMAIRQEEEKTPYTDQLVRLKDELQQIMMDPKMEPGLKLKLLNDRSSVFRDMLRRSREGRAVVATPPATAAVAGVVPTTTPKKTPKPPIPPKPSILKASTKQQQPIFPSPSPLSTKPAILAWDPDVIDPVTPQKKSPLRPAKKRRRMSKQEKNQMSRDLLKAKRNLLKEMMEYKQTRRGSTPLAERTRSKTKQQKGSGYLDTMFGTLPGWKNVRFARMMGI